jgi:Leucine-rich repeat (LRR) protein
MQLQTAAARMFCPTHCRCPDQHSTVVNCHRAGLRRVPFPLPEGTIVLDLDRNRIGIMTNESLGGSSSGPVTVASSGHEDAGSGCGQLEIISIQDNGLTRIEAGAFAALVQLRILRLGGNRLKALPVGLFDSCRRLQVLDLHDNLLTGAPPDHVMYHVHGLVSLNVSHNRLTSPVLGPGFRYVTQLGDIDMSGN